MSGPSAPATLDWYGCATFRLRVAGLTIFLDAYIDRAPIAPGTGLTADDVEACDWIVVGHAHFDHLWGAERIVKNTGARLIASYESVRVMEAAGVPLDRMICVAGGETVDLGNDVRVSVYPSQHSCVWSHAQMHQPDDVCIGDLGVTWQEREERMRALGAHIASLDAAAVAHVVAGAPGHSTRGDGGALVYVFDTPEGRLLFQDTSGHWSGVLRDVPRPDVAILAAAGRGNVDGEPIQGSLAAFVGRQVELLGRPHTVVLCHHDDWLPGFSVDTNVTPIRAEIARVAPNTRLLELGYLDATAIFAAG